MNIRNIGCGYKGNIHTEAIVIVKKTEEKEKVKINEKLENSRKRRKTEITTF